MSHGDDFSRELGANGMGFLFDLMHASRQMDDQHRQGVAVLAVLAVLAGYLGLIDSQESTILELREAVAAARFYLGLPEP